MELFIRGDLRNFICLAKVSSEIYQIRRGISQICQRKLWALVMITDVWSQRRMGIV